MQWIQERKLEIAGGCLYYEVSGEEVRITRYQGRASEVEVPERIEGMPVTGIRKKAFLSRKDLERVKLPDTLEEIGDWAFACCGALEWVRLPGKDLRFGKAVFLECGSLTRITDGRDGFPAELLAAAVRELEAYYLLDMAEAGGGEWLKKWDARLLAQLHEPDLEGYSRQVLCGEEDYSSTDQGAYVNGRRRKKARLALLRCLFSRGLDRRVEEELKEYLRAHTKGGESEEAWQVILEEYGDCREYYELFAELGCVGEDNLDGILSDIGERRPEMKAYFLRRRQGQPGGVDFFSALEL